MSSKLIGTGVALVTPFHADGSIDFKSYKKLINSLIANKVDYLVPMGTTGESVTLTKDEKQRMYFDALRNTWLELLARDLVVVDVPVPKVEN